MKRILLILTMFLCLPLLGITYLHVDGSDFAEVEPPASIEITADMAEEGNVLMFKIFEDSNMNGELDSTDQYSDYFGIIDGVPSIGDIEEDEYIVGDDDSTANAQILHIPYLGDSGDPEMGPASFTIFLIAEDEDGSTAQATIQMNFTGETEDPEVPVIHGNISVADDGSPIEDAMVVFSDMEENEYSANSDEDGNYIVDIPSEGEYTFTALVDLSGDHSSLMMGGDTFTVASDSTEMDYELIAFDSEISGRVTYSETDEPVSDIVIFSVTMDYTTFSVTRTGDDGFYTLGQNYGSMIMIQASADDYEVDTAYMFINVTEPEMTGFDFQLLQMPFAIRGHVYHPDSTPVPMCEVVAMGSEDHFLGMTNQYGEYSIRVDSGDYFVRTEYIMRTEPRSIEVTIDSADISGIDFFLNYGDGLKSVSGNVSTSSDGAIEDAYVILSPEDELFDWKMTMTDADGNYMFDEVLPGYWYIGSYRNDLTSREPDMYIIEHTLDTDSPDNDFVINVEAIKEDIVVAGRLNLLGACPNPFNPKTEIIFSSDSQDEIDISVYNEVGRLIKKVRKQVSGSGRQSIEFDGENLPSGTYFYKIESENIDESGKMILIK
ncbi:MAG: T9SS type A sorting domain-containing protein [Candidatus Zixiibacteriota bacterium]